MAWTQSQEAAIDKRNADILVSAAAGSGKTAVLTERVINRIMGSDVEEPITLDRFLIVTFTSAAANEMKERIMHKLSDKMESLQEAVLGDDNEGIQKQIAYLEKQISLVQTASISTIHSFCLKVIKTYFHKLEIDPNIKVGSEAELTIMKMEILQEMMEDKFEEEDQAFLKIADIYGSVQGMSSLAALILDIHTFSKSTPFPEAWLDEKVSLLCSPYETLEDTPWTNTLKIYFLNQMKDLRILYAESIALCKSPNGPELYQDSLEDDLQQIAGIQEGSSLEEMALNIQKVTFKAFSRKKQDCDEVLKERVKSSRDFIKKVIKGMQEELAYIMDPSVRKYLPRAGENMGILIELIKEFEGKYQEAKLSAGFIDYNDLEHLCMGVLVKPIFNAKGRLEDIEYTDAAKELSQFYKEIYIDEYQDSNTVQEMILNAIAQANKKEGPTRFMVGDMKQSIYRFRLANPLIFARKYETWHKYLPFQDTDEKQVCIDLSQNFRSRANLLKGINELFDQLMSKEVGELDYDDYARLKVGNHYQEGLEEVLAGNTGEQAIQVSEHIELHILETKEKDEALQEDQEETEELRNTESEALMTASLIDKLLKGEGNPTHIYDKECKGYRKVEPRDIVILLRATKNKAAYYEKALMGKGIGAYADVSSSFFETMEIQTILSFLKIIDNPMQDIPLITVLRSPIVGVNLDDLTVIRKSSEEGCFYEALKAYCISHNPKKSIQMFMEELLNYRQASTQLTIEELIAKIYAETGYYQYAGMLPTGVKKKANLELFKFYASEFERKQNGRLFNFLQYLDKIQETSEALGEAKLMGEHENLVRIMSIHKSKGLEFGIVFLCDTAKQFNQRDMRKSVLLHSELGLAPDFMDSEAQVKYLTLPKIAVKTQLMSENISEEMRILYVALTRAKEKLFITGTTSNFVKKAEKWSLFAARSQKEILPLGIKKSPSYLDWIGMSLFSHPELQVLRDTAQIKSYYQLEIQSKWQLFLWDKQNLSLELKEKTIANTYQKEFLKDWDPAISYGSYKEEIYKRLSFEYPYERAVLLPTKLSVSEIKNGQENHGVHKFRESLKAQRRMPNFMQEESPIQGARRGTLIHQVFEHVDFRRYTTREEITEILTALIDAQKVEKEVLQVIDLERFIEVANSHMMERMRKAKHVWKEKQFVYLSDATKIDANYPENEKILIQGVIDTVFIEEDGLVIIDYKTDYIDLKQMEISMEHMKEKYQRQLELYAQAIEGITKMPVKEKCMYLYPINQWLVI